MIAIDLTGEHGEIEAIFALANEHPQLGEASEPTSLDASRSLNVGLPGLTPTEILSFLSLLFATGKSALEFFKLLREMLKKNNAKLAVSESATGKSLGIIDGATTDQQLERLVQ